MFLQSMLQNSSTLGRLGAVTLAVPRLAAQIETSICAFSPTQPKIVFRQISKQLSLPFLQQGVKGVLFPLCSSPKSEDIHTFIHFIHKTYVPLSRPGEMGGGKMGVGEMGRLLLISRRNSYICGSLG